MSYPHPKEVDYERAAREAGWRWSDAHAGYVNAEYRDDETSDYVVMDSLAEACALAKIDVEEVSHAYDETFGR